MNKPLKNNALALACAALACQLAHAQNPETGDTLQFRAAATLEHDSNVLRAPVGRSDEMGILSAGVRLDKRYSLQRITLDAEVATYRFRDLGELDYSTLNYNAAWNFQFTPRLRGLASAERRQYRDLTDSFGGGPRSDRRTDRNEVLEATYDVTGGWRALGGVTRSSSDSEQLRATDASPTVVSARVGAGYEFGSGSSVYARLRRGDGEYRVAQAGRNFRETEVDLVVRRPLTAKTTVEGRIGHLEREHDDAPFRDFSGVVGSVNLGWEVTAKTRLDAGVARELGAYEFGPGGSVRGTRVFVGPTWKPTEKTAVVARYQREQRDWRTISPASPDAGRDDTTQIASLTGQWEPRRNLLVSVGLRHERRSSSIALYDYRANIVSVGAKATF